MVKLEVGNWISPNDFPTGKGAVMFLDEGKVVSKEETGFKEDSFEILVDIAPGKKRTWTMNKTSQRAVISKFGEETKTWIGKSCNVVVLDVQVKGEMKKSITAVV